MHPDALPPQPQRSSVSNRLACERCVGSCSIRCSDKQHPAIRTTAPNPLERRQLAGIARHLVLALLPLLGPTIIQFLLSTLRQHLSPSDEQARQADADGHARTRGAEESANPETEPEQNQN